MRYSSDHKAKTRKSILSAASRVFRRRGYQGAGVDAVMKEVEVRARHLEWMAGASGRTRLRRFVDGYLSGPHRRHSEQGCPARAGPASTPACRCRQNRRRSAERRWHRDSARGVVAGR